MHRWPALVLGLLLVLETTSGALLLYRGDIEQAIHHDLYRHTTSSTATAAGTSLTPERAISLVHAAHPDFAASWVATDRGVYTVGDAAYATVWFVDPGSGRINGSYASNGGFWGLMTNLHDCAFACPGFPLYSAALAKPVHASWPGELGALTRATAALAVLGVLMILLGLTSLKIWWPGLKKLGSRFVVRRGRGRFARDFDLHNVIGAVALPFVLMWGITGAAFELPSVEKAWLTITGGHAADEPEFDLTSSAPYSTRPAVTAQEAVAAAQARVPGRVTAIYLPTKETNYYEIDLVTGYGSRQHRQIYTGDAYVLVDPHDAGHATVLDAGTGEPRANRFYNKFFEPAHFGWQVNGWWRAIWFVLGLAPLALFVTGVSTWLWRLGVRRRRRRATLSA